MHRFGCTIVAMSRDSRAPSMADSPPTASRSWPDCVPTLVDTASGVTLRAHREDDLPALVEQAVDPQTVRWTVTPTPYALADAREFVFGIVAGGWNGGSTASWAIEAEIDGEPRYCGTIDLRFKHTFGNGADTGRPATAGGLGELGFVLHPDARGRSILSNAARLVRDWGFDVADLAAISWAAHVGNWPSRRVAAALGMVDEGVQRARLPHRGKLVDAWTATLRREDPRTSRARRSMPVMTGERVRLRPPHDSDVARMMSGAADPDTQHWLAGLPAAYGPGEAWGFLELIREWEFLGLHWSWVIADPATDEFLGSVTLFRLGDEADHGEIGYWVHPDSRGRGVATEAVALVADLALGAGGPHHSLTIRTARGNDASARVAASAGFTPTGFAAGAERLRDGSHPDLLIHSRVREN